MDFALDEEQTLLRDSVLRYLERDYGFERRRIVAEREGGFSRAHWQCFAEMGWLGVTLPPALGGLGAGAVEAALLHEALGGALVLEPVAAVAVEAAQAILSAANASQCKALLAPLIDGTQLFVLAHDESDAHGAAAAVSCRVHGDGGLRLTGRKTLLPGGPQADAFLVSALDDSAGDPRCALSLYFVPADAAGLRRRNYRLLDGSAACDLELEAVPLRADARLGAPGAACAALRAAREAAIVAGCAETIGAVGRALALTREHLLQRRQFGVAIASFQALRHRLADMLIALEQARAMLHRALAALAAADCAVRCRDLVLAAKLVGRNGRWVGAQAIQLHGAMGIADETPIAHGYKRLLVLEQRLAAAAACLREPAPGTRPARGEREAA
ncbi:MAG TPA: acyl-CoA dehydrogenase [Burkholderiaceae bacterium]|nr:acyl-CoA dehydrogenase [Burkholderiaceae bacterium]